MRINIAKVKQLQRRGRLTWFGHNRTKKSATLQVEITWMPAERTFFGVYRQRANRDCRWTGMTYLNSDQVAHLQSLLAPEDIAACLAASITRTSGKRPVRPRQT